MAAVTMDAGVRGRGRSLPSGRKLLGWALTLAFIGIWAVTVRPTTLGGPAAFVGVHGTSMHPTMHGGDMVITRERDTYAVGDVVAYRVPKGETGEGHNVIHRIVGGDGVEGYTTQGDNNAYTDTWHPKDGDVIGEVWVTAPNLATWLGKLRQPWTLAILVGVVTFVVMVAPDRRKRQPRDGERERGALATDIDADVADDAVAGRRSRALGHAGTAALVMGVVATAVLRRDARGERRS